MLLPLVLPITPVVSFVSEYHIHPCISCTQVSGHIEREVISYPGKDASLFWYSSLGETGVSFHGWIWYVLHMCVDHHALFTLLRDYPNQEIVLPCARGSHLMFTLEVHRTLQCTDVTQNNYGVYNNLTETDIRCKVKSCRVASWEHETTM